MATSEEKGIFPKTIYITREKDRNSDERYLLNYEDLDGIEDEQLVATYELKQVDQLEITRKLTPRKR